MSYMLPTLDITLIVDDAVKKKETVMLKKD